MPTETQYRADVDATVSFTNGGRLSVEGFRLDLPGPATMPDQVGALLVASLGLLMADEVHVTRLDVLEEEHKGTRGGPSDASPGTALGPGSPARLIELSHVIEAGMTTYPGLPGPQIDPHLTREASRAVYAPGTEFAIDRISMVGNTGTYLDSPFHRFEHGPDLARLPLASVVDLPTVVVRTIGSGVRGVDVGALVTFEVRGAAVLLHTGGDAGWRTPAYTQDAPFLTADGAAWLVEHGAVLVGIDSVNIDDTGDPTRPAHTTLLHAGIPIVEHLTGLGQLPVHGARFTAAPPRVAGFGTFPVRAFAIAP